MTVEAILREIRTLPIGDRKRLISLIVESLTEHPRQTQAHDILEFEGIAAHLADEEDPQARISRTRDEWDQSR